MNKIREIIDELSSVGLQVRPEDLVDWVNRMFDMEFGKINMSPDENVFYLKKYPDSGVVFVIVDEQSWFFKKPIKTDVK